MTAQDPERQVLRHLLQCQKRQQRSVGCAWGGRACRHLGNILSRHSGARDTCAELGAHPGTPLVFSNWHCIWGLCKGKGQEPCASGRMLLPSDLEGCMWVTNGKYLKRFWQFTIWKQIVLGHLICDLTFLYTWAHTHTYFKEFCNCWLIYSHQCAMIHWLPGWVNQFRELCVCFSSCHSNSTYRLTVPVVFLSFFPQFFL